jgi:hypothetical protein
MKYLNFIFVVINMNYCNICFLQKLQYNFLPCNHGLCNDCLEQLKQENCPYCRKTFDKSKILSQSQEANINLLSTSEPIKISTIDNPQRLVRSVERKKKKKRKKPSKYYTKSKKTIKNEPMFVFDDEDEIQFSGSSI